MIARATVAAALAILAACSTAPTIARCERQAERTGRYGTDAVHNILERDTRIRRCLAAA